MDKAISTDVKRKQKLKSAITVGFIVTLVIVLFTFLRHFIKPKIESSKITIASAEIGKLEATIPATGIVIPEKEFLLTSPINAKVERILRHIGDTVKAGESILQLNKESVLTDYNKYLDEQEVNKNKINQLQINFERNLNNLQTQYSIKEIQLQNISGALEHEKSLALIGGGTAEKVKQATLNLTIAKLELEQVKSDILNQKKIMDADLKSLGYQISIQNKNILEIKNKLNLAEVQSPSDGIITWVVDRIGAEVNTGAEISKIADLTSYKVEASISDNYASQIRTGGAVIVKIGAIRIPGRITNVQPAVENGTVKFFINLEKKNHPILRSNLKSDVFVITSLKNDIVRVKNGPAFNGSRQQKVFIIKDNELVSRNVVTGDNNYDYMEIISGIKAGEKVVISDMQDYLTRDKVELEN